MAMRPRSVSPALVATASDHAEINAINRRLKTRLPPTLIAANLQRAVSTAKLGTSRRRLCQELVERFAQSLAMLSLTVADGTSDGLCSCDG
jgi:hypothetical protein